MIEDLFNLRVAAASMPLEKGEKVKFGNTKYSYLNIASCVQPLSRLMAEHNFCHYWTGKDAGDASRVVLSITLQHKSGASIGSTMSAPVDAGGGKSAGQAVGSTITYLQRYLLLSILGMAAGQDDDCAPASREKPIPTQRGLTPHQVKALREVNAGLTPVQRKNAATAVHRRFGCLPSEVPHEAFNTVRSILMGAASNA